MWIIAKYAITVSESHSPSHRRPRQSPDQSPEFWSPAPALLISTSINTTCSLTLIVRSTVHYPEQYLTHLSLVATTNLYCCLPETSPAILLCVRPVFLCLPAPQSPKIELPAPRSPKIELPAPRSPKKGTLINTPSDWIPHHVTHLLLSPLQSCIINKPSVLPLTCLSVICLWHTGRWHELYLWWWWSALGESENHNSPSFKKSAPRSSKNHTAPLRAPLTYSDCE